jgi:AcrR family transcriptional regulator
MVTRATASTDVRAPLNRDRVLQAAIELADRDGIDALSMRRLAQLLGVEAMSLYHHVANKDEILDGMVDAVVGEIDLPALGMDWKPAMRRLATSAYDVYLRHPWAAGLSLATHGVGPARKRYMDAMLGTFRRAGFSPGLTDHAYHATESHIMGFTLWQVGMNLGTQEDMAAIAAGFLEQVSAEEFPHLVEHVHQHMQPPEPDDEGEFAFALEILLDGLERKRATEAE